MAKVNLSQFVREVRQEVSKVTWATRKETIVATGMVFIFVIMAAVFFFFVDRLMASSVRFLLGLGN